MKNEFTVFSKKVNLVNVPFHLKKTAPWNWNQNNKTILKRPKIFSKNQIHVFFVLL